MVVILNTTYVYTININKHEKSILIYWNKAAQIETKQNPITYYIQTRQLKMIQKFLFLNLQ